MDDTPYLIVDNQKLSPIERLPRRERPSAGPSQSTPPAFGVVDRVTISDEARARARARFSRIDQPPPGPQDEVEKVSSAAPLLTYSPNGRRP